MNRAEIWVQFALGAIGQFPTATTAAAAADDLLREFEERFRPGRPGEVNEWKEIEEHKAWKARSR